MRKLTIALAVCLLVTSVTLGADAPGTATGKMTVGGRSTELHWAVAKPEKEGTRLLLSNVKVTPEQLDDIGAMLDLAGSGKLTGVSVLITPENHIISSELYSPLFKLQGNSFSAVGMHEFTPAKAGSGEIAGKLNTSHESSFNGVTFSYSATFRAEVTKPKPEAPPALKGTPLPAGGGEPAKAYAAYAKSVSSGNFAAVKKAVAAERLKQMERDPDFEKMFPLIQAMQPKNIKITGGAIDGDTATLIATGSSDGDPANGIITMKREAGSWKVDNESWKSKHQ